MLPPKKGMEERHGRTARKDDEAGVSAHCKRKKGRRGRGKRGAPPKGGAQCELVDKPGSVADDHSSATSVTARL